MSETFSDSRASLTEQEGGTRRSPLRDFLHGAALIFDFGGRLGQRGITTTRHASDASRLEADWWAVGNDMRRAMGQPPVKHPTS